MMMEEIENRNLVSIRSNFDKCPVVNVSDDAADCSTGWDAIVEKIENFLTAERKERVVVAVDCYHGVLHAEAIPALKKITHSKFIVGTDALKGSDEVAKIVYPDVTDDRVFGYMTELTIDRFFDPDKVDVLRKQIRDTDSGIIIVYGEGAAHIAPENDVLIYLDMARWEIQLRMRRNEVSNFGVENKFTEFSLQYKQAYFVDWRVLDRHKVAHMDRWDFLIDTNKPGEPKMISGKSVMQGLVKASQRPFRVVPFFDPGPWGGQWLKEVADLDRTAVNFAWGFDCVPEENSLLLGFGDKIVEIPSINLVFHEPVALLGQKVFERFGAEFPIRFDFLDTMGGGNLSLQVHPTTQYIKEHFGMDYTQDESYYMLDAGDDACVYLGITDDADPKEMIADLKLAQIAGGDFDAEKYVKKWPVKKHDHVLIPAGTVHCSGKDSVVLEISATPYIFTFKLWDWGRLGLDGKPRPINIEHGEKVIAWNRRESWTKENLMNRVVAKSKGDGWTEESTGLHESQFIETRRHWFTKAVQHHTEGRVNVINLIEGREVIVESPTNAFEPYVIHYAETFIVPAAVGAYVIRPHGESAGKRCATLKAFVRNDLRGSWTAAL